MTHVGIDVARLAKLAGFDWRCPSFSVVSDDTEYVAPTQTELQRWLREEKNIQVYARSHTKKNGKWGDYIALVDNFEINDARDEEFQKYEDALEVGLEYALEKYLQSC